MTLEKIKLYRELNLITNRIVLIDMIRGLSPPYALISMLTEESLGELRSYNDDRLVWGHQESFSHLSAEELRYIYFRIRFHDEFIASAPIRKSFQYENIKSQMERYGGGPDDDLLPILDAVTDLNDDLNHDRHLQEAVDRIQYALDTFKKEVVGENGTRRYQT